MAYRLGDEVVLKILENFGYSEPTLRHAKVQIIGMGTQGPWQTIEYLCYVPPYESVPKSFPITRSHVKYYGVAPKFVGDDGCFITAITPIHKHIPAIPAERCDNCDEPIQGAIRDSFGVYVCRACRENPYR